MNPADEPTAQEMSGPGAGTAAETLAPQQRDDGYSIRAVQRVCDIIDLVQKSPDGFTLNDVARTGVPKSTAFRYLSTLMSRNYVVRDSLRDAYRMGPALSSFQFSGVRRFADRAKMYLESIRDKYGETANLGILDGLRVTCIEIVESERAVRLAARIGDRDPIHCTALGKAIAAHLAPAKVEAILSAEGMPRKTPMTITDPVVYMKALAEIRAQGYAVDDEENEVGGRCVAVPVTGTAVPTAISLSAPASRFGTDAIPDAVEDLRTAARAMADDLWTS